MGWCGVDGCIPNCYVDSDVAVAAGVWTHVAGTWDGATARIYVDGVPAGQAACILTPGSVNDTPLLIGTEWIGAPADRSFIGDIFEAIVWEEPLTSEQLLQLYLGMVPSGASGHWLFDEIGPDVVNDLSGYGRDGVPDPGVEWVSECPPTP